ncbi:MAG: mannose-1-phosphate guanylyltransferase [Pseudomonadota bacterium]
MNHNHSKNLYAVIMAGGEGTRFYPLSTPEKPKQFLNFIGEKTFIRQTFDRMLPLFACEKIYISTNEKYVDLVKEQIPELPEKNIIAEPCKKNTAPALSYATKIIHMQDGESIICCVPSDHYIPQENLFHEVIKQAIEIAQKDYLVTLGINPTWPSVDYGYISPAHEGDWSPVKNFTEKPNEELAKTYIDEGYLWNAGIFVWRASKFLSELKTHATEVYESINIDADSGDFLKRCFEQSPSISVDYALLEKSQQVAVVKAAFDWSDVGGWGSVKLLQDNGVTISPDVATFLNHV